MQYTLRGIPEDLDLALRQKAKAEGRSLNEIAVDALSRGVGLDAATVTNHDLDFAIGTWMEDSEFEATLMNQRQIDADLWK